MSIHAELYGDIEVAGLLTQPFRKTVYSLDEITQVVQSIESNDLIIDYFLTVSVDEIGVPNSNRACCIWPWFL